MAETYSYSIVEISKEQVLSKIATYKYHVFAVNIATHEVKQTDTLTADELVNMVSGNEWLYFHIKEKAMA